MIDHVKVGRRKVPVTAADRIVATLRANGFMHDAAARAGIATETLRAWRTKGNRARGDITNGRRRFEDLDDHEAACVELADRMERAETDAKVELVEVLLATARGGLIQQRVIEQVNPDTGEVLSRRVEKITAPHDAKWAAWLLSHRYSDYRGHQVELTGPGGGPIQLDVDAKVRLLEAAERAAERLGVGPSGNGDAG